VLGCADFGVEFDVLKNVEFLGISPQVLVDFMAQDVDAVLDVDAGLLECEVSELIVAAHIVGFEAGVQAMFSPHAADGGLVIENDQGRAWVALVICLCGAKTVPSCSNHERQLPLVIKHCEQRCTSADNHQIRRLISLNSRHGEYHTRDSWTRRSVFS
jgi:hypothetical protein